MSLLTLTEKNFKEEVLDSPEAILVDFWADWCAPCRSMSYVLETLAKENPELRIGKVNVDEEETLADNYAIMSIPTLLLFHHGKIIREFTGMVDKEDLLDALRLLPQS